MEILEFGNKDKPKIILIHGFLSPYQIWDEYIEYYKKYYHIIIPILPGHNLNKKEEFISFESCAKELEDYYISNYGNQIYAIYAMSMGGILASHIWINKKIKIDKLIFESTPLLPFNNLMKSILTKYYLNITHKTQRRNEKTIKQAINTIITIDKLLVFIELIDNISDKNIINYIKEVSKFKLPNNIENKNTEITYYYGSKINEIPFKKVAKYIKENYKNSKIICLEGKGHCEDALINPKIKIKDLDKILL